MSDVKISGYGDDLTINGIRIGDLGPAEHEAINWKRVVRIMHHLKMSW